MEVITLSIARNILKNDSRDRERMRIYAKSLSEFHIVVLTRKKHGYSKEIHEGNLHIYPTNSYTRFSMLVDAYRIGVKIAKKEDSNKLVVSAQDPLEIGWTSWFISRKKKSIFHVQVHGDYFNDTWSRGSVIRKLQQKTILKLLKKAKAIRTVSDRVKKSLAIRGIDAEKITVLPIRPETENFLKKEHVFNTEESITFLYVGRFAPEKDIARILDAFTEVCKTNKGVKLKLVGTGAGEKKIKSQIKTNEIDKAVEVVEWTEDIPQVMNDADVLLLASLHESYGLVLIEAMAVGLPLITTNVGCVGEIVKDRVHGLVVNDSGVIAYACMMQEMIQNTDKRREYGENGKKTAKSIGNKSMQEYVDAWVSSMSV